MLAFARSRIPTPPEALPFLHLGDFLNLSVHIHDWVMCAQPRYRSFDSKGTKLLFFTHRDQDIVQKVTPFTSSKPFSKDAKATLGLSRPLPSL